MEKFNNIYKEVIESFSQNTEQILDTTNKTEVQRTYELFVEKCRIYNFPIMLTPEEFVNIFVENNKYCTIRQKHEIEKIADEYYFEFEKKDDEREIKYYKTVKNSEMIITSDNLDTFEDNKLYYYDDVKIKKI